MKQTDKRGKASARKPSSSQISMWWPTSLHKATKVHAQKCGLTLSSYLRQLSIKDLKSVGLLPKN